MAKFCVGDVVQVVNGEYNLPSGHQHTVLYCGESSSGCEDYMVGISAAEPQWDWFRFKLVKKYVEPTLQELYNIEADKLHEQAAKVDAAWRLLKAETLIEQNARKAILHAKRCLVDRARDTLKEASDFYLQISDELDEMLRNEPF